MVACNSLSMFLGLVLTILMITFTHCIEEDITSSNMNDFDQGKFTIGSRYGRSPHNYESKSRSFRVSPRSDRFFLGSRYGKRTYELAKPAYEQSSMEINNLFMMSCIYTGVKNFYRCSDADMFNDVLNQLSSEEKPTSN